MNRPRHNPTPACARRRGFTMVELMVVMGIIAVLAAALVTVSAGVWRKASEKKTLSLLQVVQQAIDDFKKNPPVFVNKSQGEASYKKRYGPYPPDELEVFSDDGIPGAEAGLGQTLAPGKAKVIMTGGSFAPMTFGRSPAMPALEHRDLGAMLLAIELYSEQGKMILDRIEPRYWSEGAANAGDPSQFLDRDNNGTWSEGDTQIRWLIDDWETPLVYYTQRSSTGSSTDQSSSNGENWNRSSTEMVRVNGGQPIIMSYGQNGPDQLAGQAPADGVLLHDDWEDDQKINHPLNEDNIYVDESLKEKLAKGITP